MLLVLLVCYTAVFIVVTQCSSPQRGALRDESENGCVADYLYFMPGLKFEIKLNTFLSLSVSVGLFVVSFSGGLEEFQRNWGSVGHSQRQETCCFYQIQPRRQLCRFLP